MKLSAVLLAAVLLITACSDDATGPTTPSVTPDEYAVYSALIDSIYISERIELVVIRALTEPFALSDPGSAQHVREKLGVSDALLDAYAARNTGSIQLERKFTFEPDYVLVHDSTVQRLWAVDGWAEYYRQYPNSQGYMTLSRVGFSTDGNTALVYASNMLAPLAGAGIAALMKRQSGEWKIANTIVVWIS